MGGVVATAVGGGWLQGAASTGATLKTKVAHTFKADALSPKCSGKPGVVRLSRVIKAFVILL